MPAESPPKPPPTLYEWIGGMPAIERLTLKRGKQMFAVRAANGESRRIA